MSFTTYNTDVEYKLKSFHDRMATIASEILETLDKKNADYGSAYASDGVFSILDPGEKLLVRMDDKILRISNLLNNASPAVWESLDDSFKDLIGYALLWLDRRRMQNVSES